MSRVARERTPVSAGAALTILCWVVCVAAARVPGALSRLPRLQFSVELCLLGLEDYLKSTLRFLEILQFSVELCLWGLKGGAGPASAYNSLLS